MSEFGSEKTARLQYEALGMDYEKDRPKLSSRAFEIYNVFSLLNRRRIEHRPLQKNDIMSEIEGLSYPDIALTIIEDIDSDWLRREAERIAKKRS